jgi:hypothetical protein
VCVSFIKKCSWITYYECCESNILNMLKNCQCRTNDLIKIWRSKTDFLNLNNWSFWRGITDDLENIWKRLFFVHCIYEQPNIVLVADIDALRTIIDIYLILCLLQNSRIFLFYRICVLQIYQKMPLKKCKTVPN